MRQPISVVIPTKDRAQLLEGCLAALLPTLQPDDEVIVVDSASSTADTLQTASRFGVQCIRAVRAGSSLARNLGWQAASQPLIAFIDDDVRVRPGWAEAAVRTLQERDYVVARVSQPDDQDADRPVAIRDDATPREITQTSTPVFEASACVAFRREVLERTAGFDERLGPGTWWSAAEDLDLFDRVRRAGFLGRFEPTMHADHEQWRGRRQLLRLEWSYGKGMGGYLWLVSRRNGHDAWWQARQVLWADGLAKIAPAVKVRFEFAIVCELLRASATVIAFVAAAARLRRS